MNTSVSQRRFKILLFLRPDAVACLGCVALAALTAVAAHAVGYHLIATMLHVSDEHASHIGGFAAVIGCIVGGFCGLKLGDVVARPLLPLYLELVQDIMSEPIEITERHSPSGDTHLSRVERP